MAHAGHFMCAEKKAKTQSERNFFMCSYIAVWNDSTYSCFLELLLWNEITNEKIKKKLFFGRMSRFHYGRLPNLKNIKRKKTRNGEHFNIDVERTYQFTL